MATQTKTFWDDIETGRILKTGSVTLEAADIRVFAAKFDPQPYHLDRDAGKDSLFGGLCASGWHVSALNWPRNEFRLSGAAKSRGWNGTDRPLTATPCLRM